MRWCVVLAVVIGVIIALDAKRFRSDYKYFPKAEGFLKLHRIPANWKEARLRCHLEGAKIASPLNENIKSSMISMMDATPKLKCGVFLGVHATFSKGDFFSAEGVPLSKIPHNWAAGEPDNYNDTESCILMTDTGEFADVNCEDTYPYFCYKKSTSNLVVTPCGTTDPEYFFESRTGSCYKFHTVPRNWSRAFMACAAEGGYLAIINSETEAQVIKELFAKYPASKMLGSFWKDVAYLGFHDYDEHGEWLTINDDALNEAGYSKFSAGEPNNATPGEFCGATYRSGLLDDLWCHYRYAFICEKDPSSLVCDDDCNC